MQLNDANDSANTAECCRYVAMDGTTGQAVVMGCLYGGLNGLTVFDGCS